MQLHILLCWPNHINNDPTVCRLNDLLSTTTSDTITTTSIPPPSLSSSPAIPSTTTTISTYVPYPLPTGTWALNGELASTNDDCIQTIDSITFKEVWACDTTEPREITISSDGGRGYLLDLGGTNVTGVQGEPPTSENADTAKGESPFWIFNVPDYTTMSPDVPFGCEVQVTLQFVLGRSKSMYLWFE